MKPSFTTKSLTVFEIDADFDDDMLDRRKIYIAFRDHADDPTPAVTLTVMADHAELFGGHWVDWIETHPKRRRMGFATELCEAVNARLGPLALDGVTPEGEAFAEAFVAKLTKEELERSKP